MAELTGDLSDSSGADSESQKKYKKWFDRCLLVLASGAVFFILSPWDANLRAYLGIKSLVLSSSATLTGLTVFGISFIVEAGSAIIVYVGMRRNRGFANWVEDVINFFTPKKRAKKTIDADASSDLESEFVEVKKKNYKSTFSKFFGSAADYGMSMGIGSGFVPIKNVPKNYEDETQWQDIKSRMLKTATAVSLSYGLVGFLAGGGINLAESFDQNVLSQVNVFEFGWLDNGAVWVAEQIVTWAPDWRVWTYGTFGIWGLLSVYGQILDKMGLAEPKAKREKASVAETSVGRAADQTIELAIHQPVIDLAQSPDLAETFHVANEASLFAEASPELDEVDQVADTTLGLGLS